MGDDAVCDRHCCERTGRWCDACWHEILKGGWYPEGWEPDAALHTEDSGGET